MGRRRGASASPFPPRTSLRMKNRQQTYAISNSSRRTPAATTPITSCEAPEEGEGVVGSLRLMVTVFPGTRASPLAWVPDFWSTHLRSLKGLQGVSTTIPSGHLGTDTGRTWRGSVRESWPDEEKEGTISHPVFPDKTVEEGRAPTVCRAGSLQSPLLGEKDLGLCTPAPRAPAECSELPLKELGLLCKACTGFPGLQGKPE